MSYKLSSKTKLHEVKENNKAKHCENIEVRLIFPGKIQV